MIKEKIQNVIGEDFKVLELKEDAHTNLLKIVIDGDDNITLATTTKISRKLQHSEVIDKFYPDGYRLEVSSPGIGSPLVHPFQYRKNIGRTLSFRYQDDEKVRDMDAKLVSVDESHIVISNKNGQLTLSYDDIVRAVVVISFQ
ncbi:MAG: hypothetical protein HQ509_10825 [Candidatus Marinimicrobia bacterium]|nr:hypothetical protein [Candidatus Neomarinimicrobiota bacterium]